MPDTFDTAQEAVQAELAAESLPDRASQKNLFGQDDVSKFIASFASGIAKIRTDATRLIALMTPAVALVQAGAREIFAALGPLIERLIFPNWQGARLTTPAILETLLLKEGLPLAWVPPSSVFVRLVAAKSESDRRRIIGGSSVTIIRHCRLILVDLKAADTTELAKFALFAADAIEAGHWQAGQSLASNVLDTTLRSNFTVQELQRITNRNKTPKFELDEHVFRDAIVLGGIWGAYGPYWADKGDPIPSTFSRHASTHAVSKRQYSKRNALIALMHATALLKLVEARTSVTTT